MLDSTMSESRLDSRVQACNTSHSATRRSIKQSSRSAYAAPGSKSNSEAAIFQKAFLSCA